MIACGQSSRRSRRNCAADASAIPEQGQWLAQVVRGFFAYHAVPTNFPALRAFHHHVTVSWLRTLQRRSQKDRTTWQRIAKIASEYLPQRRRCRERRCA